MSPLKFIDNPTIKDQVDNYISIDVDSERVIKSWRSSLRAFEWVLPNGEYKDAADLPPKDQERLKNVMESISKSKPLERPILGIGLLENIEIGVGRATFLTLAAAGYDKISVHVRKSNQDEFEKYKAQ